MADADAPPPAKPRLTIRVGQDVFSDVQDYVVLIRDRDNAVVSRASSDSWAVGACEGLLIEVDARRRRAADEEEES